jgi:hypothetical protein
MIPIPSIPSVPDVILPFDHLTTCWNTTQIALLAVLGGSLCLGWLRQPNAARESYRRAGQRPTRRTPAPSSRRHLRRVV